MGRCKRDETRCDIEIATLRNELEKAKAALEVTADTLRDCHQELEASGYAYDHPSLIRYRLAVDNARAQRDAKEEG